MRNILTALLVIGIIVLGFIVLKANKANQTPVDNSWPETEPATVRPTTNNSSVRIIRLRHSQLQQRLSKLILT